MKRGRGLRRLHLPGQHMPLNLLRHAKARIVILIIWITISIVSLSVAGDQKTSKENDVCSLLNTSRLSALIGAGSIVSTVRGSDCKYEHPEASDGLVPPGEADLSVLDHSPNEAKSNFEDDLKDAVKNIREGR